MKNNQRQILSYRATRCSFFISGGYALNNGTEDRENNTPSACCHAGNKWGHADIAQQKSISHPIRCSAEQRNKPISDSSTKPCFDKSSRKKASKDNKPD